MGGSGGYFRGSGAPEDLARKILDADAQTKDEGYETGVVIDEGTSGENLRFERLIMRDVATPWDTADVGFVDGDTSLTLRLRDR